MDFKGFSFNFIGNMITDETLAEFFNIAFFGFLFNYSLHFLSDQLCLGSGGVGGFFHLKCLSVGVTDAEDSEIVTVLGFAVDKGLDEAAPFPDGIEGFVSV